MAVDWGKMADSMFQGETWEESLGIWKLSNVIGWYMSNYGFIKTQLMLGLERKINLASKYEWYLFAPTKVLMYGENKIDLKEYSKQGPSVKTYGLTWLLGASSCAIDTFESNLKAAKEAKAIAGSSSTTCVGHTLTVTGGNSVETIAAGNKTITAPVGSVELESVGGRVGLNGGGSSIVLNMANVIVSGPVINLG